MLPTSYDGDGSSTATYASFCCDDLWMGASSRGAASGRRGGHALSLLRRAMERAPRCLELEGARWISGGCSMFIFAYYDRDGDRLSIFRKNPSTRVLRRCCWKRPKIHRVLYNNTSTYICNLKKN